MLMMPTFARDWSPDRAVPAAVLALIVSWYAFTLVLRRVAFRRDLVIQ
jgi:hypothetical protein